MCRSFEPGAVKNVMKLKQSVISATTPVSATAHQTKAGWSWYLNIPVESNAENNVAENATSGTNMLLQIVTDIEKLYSMSSTYTPVLLSAMARLLHTNTDQSETDRIQS